MTFTNSGTHGVGTRGYTRDPGATGITFGYEPSGFFFADDGAAIHHLADRLFIAEATRNDGYSLGGGVGADWFSAGTGVSAGLNWVHYSATVALTTSTGLVGFAAASRASDVPADHGSTQPTIPFVGIAIMDRAGSGPPYWTAYGAYLEGRIEAASAAIGTVIGLEIDAINFGGAVPVATPWVRQTTGGATALWLASGGDPANHGRAISPAQLALGIVNNGETFMAGIVFANDAIEGTDGATGFGQAISLSTRHILGWYANSGGAGTQVNYITSTSSVAGHSLQFQNGGSIFVSAGGKIDFDVINVASSVNGLRVVPAVSGETASLNAIGDATNLDLAFKPKGTGQVRLYAEAAIFYTDAGNQRGYVQHSVTSDANLNGLEFGDGGPFFFGRGAIIMGFQQNTSAVNYIEARNAIAGAAVGLYALGSSTNIPFVVQPKGTGPFQLQVADAAATGGDNRGANAVDLQTVRSFAASVASGASSIVLGGSDNRATAANSLAGGSSAQAANTNAVAIGNSAIASGQHAIALGDGNNATNTRSVAIGSSSAATGLRSMALGHQSNDRGRTGALVHSSGNTAASGDRQTLINTNLHGTTTDAATAKRLTSDAGAAGALNSVPLSNNESMRFRIMLVAQVSATSSKEWMIEGLVRRGANAASTAFVGAATITSTYGDAALATCVVACTADTTNGGLNLTVNGVAATTIGWNAWVSAAEIVN